MDRDHLKQIVTDAVREVLRERPAGEGSGSSGSGGLILMTGGRPRDAALDCLRKIGARGPVRPRAMLSFSFTQCQSALRAIEGTGIERAPLPEREPAQAVFFRASPWLLAPDLSTNSLHKVLAGVEDSLPSRAIQERMREGLPVILLETSPEDSPLRGLDRRAKLRRLERAGARIAGPDSLEAALDEAESPGITRYQPSGALSRLPRRAIVTAEEVHEAARRSSGRMLVPPDAIVTAHARDEARRLGVTLHFEPSP